MQDVNIARALPQDAEAVSELLRRTWFATYPNEEAGITAEDIRLRTDGKNGERVTQNIENWRNRIETNDGSVAVFVARTDDKIVGMTAPSIIDGKRRIGAIYVLPEVQGKGVGSQLMEKALEWHGDKQDIYLLVASYNQNAIDFYKRFGFEQTDTAVVDQGNVYGNTLIPEIEMVLKAHRVAFPEFSAELIALGEVDQVQSKGLEQLLSNAKTSAERDAIKSEFVAACHHRAQRMMEILEVIKEPSLSNIGLEASSYASVLALHSYLDEMKAVLKTFETVFEREPDNVYAESIPSLTDRIMVIESRKQMYGNNWSVNKDGKFYLIPVVDFAHINERRARYGLGPRMRPRNLSIGAVEHPLGQGEAQASDQQAMSDEEYTLWTSEHIRT